MTTSISNTLEKIFSLEGRVGIVTGASSGLGLATATLLADAGAKVYDVSLTVTTDAAARHDNIVRIQADITDRAAVERIVREIAADNGGIDFLVNNAGMTHKTRAEIFPTELWDKIHTVNVDAVFQLSQILYPYLKQSKSVGRIVNISSMAGHFGFSEVVPYCSSKSAVLGITRGLAIEWANDNILVNSVAPGWFPSAMAIQVMDEARRAKILNRMPLHRFGEMQDVANMILYLVSNAGKYVTGQDFAVDGGAIAYGF